MFISKLTSSQIGFTTLGMMTLTKEVLLTVRCVLSLIFECLPLLR